MADRVVCTTVQLYLLRFIDYYPPFVRTRKVRRGKLQGCLAHKQATPHRNHHRALCIGLLWGPRDERFLKKALRVLFLARWRPPKGRANPSDWYLPERQSNLSIPVPHAKLYMGYLAHKKTHPSSTLP